METIINELKNAQNVRSNLSKLRQLVRDSKEKELSLEELDHNNWMLPFLKSEDAKTRKNAALLLGELECENAKTALWEAYQREQTLFVKSAYLNALSHLDVEELMPELKEELSVLMTGEVLPENQKHVNEQPAGIDISIPFPVQNFSIKPNVRCVAHRHHPTPSKSSIFFPASSGRQN